MPSVRIIFLLCISVLFLWTSFAQFSAEDFISQFQTQQSKLPSAEKKAYYLKTYNTLSLLAVRNRDDMEKLALYTALKEYIKTQITLLWSGTSSTVLPPTSVSSSSVSSSWMTIPKVDLVKVREVWLNLHNAERATKWLISFTYSSALESTASTWQIILRPLARRLISEIAATGIIRTIVSNRGLVISELFLRVRKKMVKHCLRKIYDKDIILATRMIVLMILSKQSKLLGRFLWVKNEGHIDHITMLL